MNAPPQHALAAPPPQRVLRAPWSAEARAALVRALGDGSVMTFPTETSYALGGNALSAALVAAIYALKGRERGKSLLLLVPHAGRAQGWGGLARTSEPAARLLMERFWPGPLTLVLPGGTALPPHLQDERGGVALRCSPHPLVTELLELGGVPLIGTSANVSGRPALHTVQAVLQAFSGAEILAVDGGPTAGGPPSTVLDTTVRPYRIVRPGAIAASALREALQGRYPHLAPPAQELDS